MNKKIEDGITKTAYFSMEIGFNEKIPSYSGGLGILAGDTLKAAADLEIPMVGVSVLYRHGFFRQRIDDSGNQIEEEDFWRVEDYMTKRDETVEVVIEGRKIKVGVWEYILKGVSGYEVPLYFLDTEYLVNDEFDRYISHHLYPKNKDIFFNQEIVLGLAGVEILEKIGYSSFNNYHLNETHASIAVLSLKEKIGTKDTKSKVCFTTHTPLKGGHERYSKDYLKKKLESKYFEQIPNELFDTDGDLNMALLCLENSKYANGVAEKHRVVSREMYPSHDIDGVTNGVHTNTWASQHISQLFDEYIPNWSHSGLNLHRAVQIPADKIIEAHKKAKQTLINEINSEFESSSISFDSDIFTVGFARRAATYKRHNLIFTDLRRLEKIAKEVGKIQFVFAGKAHPSDEGGKKIIKEIFELNNITSENIKVVYMPNYSMSLSKLLISGVDVWLNNPVAPLEASGTSGMKASLNGVPNFSILDGWWLEGHIENVTGWSIGQGCAEGEACSENDLESLYSKLENNILPKFYNDKPGWAYIQKHAIAINSSYFNTHRMIMEYVTEAYIR